MVSGATIGRKLDHWLDEWKMAISGVVLATRNRKFLIVLALSFVIFGTLMNLLSGSTAALNLFWATDLAGKLAIIRDGFLGIFGIGRNFWDWLLLFFITLLQSILIGLVALVWRKRQRSKTEQIAAMANNADNVQSAGLAAGLAVLGSGCPTCGTTLLAPILGTVFSSGAMSIASVVSGALTLAAVLLALFTLKRIGKEAFVMITGENLLKRRKDAKAQQSTDRN